MSLFGEFRIAAEALAFHHTLGSLPELIIEIERVVATGELLTPYFWVSEVELEAFEDAVAADPSITRHRQLDQFDEGTLYRAEWVDDVDSLMYEYASVNGAILEATGHDGEWNIRLRFDDRDALGRFQSFCREQGIDFTLERLYQVSHPRTGVQYGLTPKQRDALVTASEMGYFSSPRECTLTEVADELEISQQALSNRLRRAHDSLIENTLKISDPNDTRASAEQ